MHIPLAHLFSTSHLIPLTKLSPADDLWSFPFLVDPALIFQTKDIMTLHITYVQLIQNVNF